MEERNLEIWFDRLRNQEMPIFSKTVRRLTGLVERDNSSFSELVWGILEDPSLTARVLRISNSIHYNRTSVPIGTVSRAVMKLGFGTIKNICLSIVLVEAFLKAGQKERVVGEIARAFHAAIQAKSFIERLKDESSEEVFVAALLCRIGHIAFWCFADEVGEQLDQAMQRPGSTAEKAELEVLGFPLKRLTARLAREWRLSGLLESVLEAEGENDPRVHSIALGYKIAQVAEKGWDSAEENRLTKELTKFLNLTEEKAKVLVRQNAREASDIMQSYGMKRLGRSIPLPSESPRTKQALEPSEREYPVRDHQLQLTILKDLSALLLSKKVDLNMVLSIVLEGIHRGVGMDRVFFALLTADRSFLKIKYGLGWPQHHPVHSFTLGVAGESLNIFSHVLKTQTPLWVKSSEGSEYKHLLRGEISRIIGGGPCFVTPVMVKGKVIGVVYADRQPSNRGLDEEGFESFTFFGQQASLCLSSLAS